MIPQALFPFLPELLKQGQIGGHPGMQDVYRGPQPQTPDQPSFMQRLGSAFDGFSGGPGMGGLQAPQKPPFGPVGPHQTPQGGGEPPSAIPALMQSMGARITEDDMRKHLMQQYPGVPINIQGMGQTAGLMGR